eukprot:TRINITY_DN75437_c0_g1_i1.p1 TRINITY_DN75437_c0_g1~~TRINITY_DN75437_c0_g1_i1.p1  ORF type:complete len:435 (-),score=76.62 TRINITY_DN75437_c0_g1_i1:178-1482(-)
MVVTRWSGSASSSSPRFTAVGAAPVTSASHARASSQVGRLSRPPVPANEEPAADGTTSAWSLVTSKQHRVSAAHRAPVARASSVGSSSTILRRYRGLDRGGIDDETLAARAKGPSSALLSRLDDALKSLDHALAAEEAATEEETGPTAASTGDAVQALGMPVCVVACDDRPTPVAATSARDVRVCEGGGVVGFWRGDSRGRSNSPRVLGTAPVTIGAADLSRTLRLRAARWMHRVLSAAADTRKAAALSGLESWAVSSCRADAEARRQELFPVRLEALKRLQRRRLVLRLWTWWRRRCMLGQRQNLLWPVVADTLEGNSTACSGRRFGAALAAVCISLAHRQLEFAWKRLLEFALCGVARERLTASLAADPRRIGLLQTLADLRRPLQEALTADGRPAVQDWPPTRSSLASAPARAASKGRPPRRSALDVFAPG